MRIYGCAYLFNISLVVYSNLLRRAGDTRTPLRYNLITSALSRVDTVVLALGVRSNDEMLSDSVGMRVFQDIEGERTISFPRPTSQNS